MAESYTNWVKDPSWQNTSNRLIIVKKPSEKQDGLRNMELTNRQPPGDQKPSKHGKSLQQREAEYAKARLRIFGSRPLDGGCGVSGDLRKVNGYSVQRQSSPEVMKPATSTTPSAVVTTPPKATLLRRPAQVETNGTVAKCDAS